MNFLDNLIINVSGGKGGNGCISFSKFNKSKFRIPNGGNGGNGGNIYIISDKTINCLNYLNSKKKIIAKNGFNGKSNYCSGKNGENLFIKVPIGTKIIDLNTNRTIYDLIYDKMCILLVKGGLKGLGNGICKKKYINNFCNKGKFGNNLSIKLKLELFCDLGIFGLYNSGKSSIFKIICFKKDKIFIDNKYTNYPKINKFYINNYNFLYVLDTKGIILKDFNIINKIKYLNHLNRCKLLLHIIDISIILDNKINFFNYLKKINIILKSNINLKNKEIWIIFNKLDLFNNDYNLVNSKIKNILKKFNINIKYYIISTINKDKYLKNFKYEVYNFFNKYYL